MPVQYPLRIYEKAVRRYIYEGRSIRQIAKGLDISRGTVQAAVERWAAGQPLVPAGSKGKRHRGRIFGPEELVILFELYEENDSLYLDEAQARLQAQLNRKSPNLPSSVAWPSYD